MLVTLRSFFVEMACLHGEEKGKSLPFVVNVKLKTYLFTSRQDRRYCSNCSNLIRFTWIVRVNVKVRMNETIFLLSVMSTANWSHAIDKSPVDFRKSLIRDFERRDKVLHPATRDTKQAKMASTSFPFKSLLSQNQTAFKVLLTR